jgi:hypothetical protein
VRATSIVLTGVLGLGGLTAGAVVVPAVASAQTGTSTADAVGERVSRIAEALSGLVSDGSISQAQADEVAAVLAEELPRLGHGHGRGPGGPGRGGLGRHLDAAAEVIGVSEDDLRAALEGGRSLAQVAEENDVERQAVVDALVAAASAHVDEHLAAGDITQEQADARKAELAERVGALVDREGLPARGRGRAGDEPAGGGAGSGGARPRTAGPRGPAVRSAAG